MRLNVSNCLNLKRSKKLTSRHATSLRLLQCDKQILQPLKQALTLLSPSTPLVLLDSLLSCRRLQLHPLTLLSTSCHLACEGEEVIAKERCAEELLEKRVHVARGAEILQPDEAVLSAICCGEIAA